MTTHPLRLSAHPHVLFLLSLVGLALLSAVSTPERAVAAERWTWPVDGEVLTTYLNGDDPYEAGQHRGIDVGAPVGSTVRAAAPGTVTFAGTAGSSGLTVSIRTADGRFDTSYLHLESIDVSEGDEVDQGADLGAVGVSGRRSVETPHVHFGVRDAGERHAYRDPLLFLGAQGAPPPDPVPPPVAPPARPAPRPAPAPRPVPAPAPPPRAVPAPSPRPAPVRVPVMSPKGVPSAGPASAPNASPRPVPGAAPRRLERPDPRSAEAPRPAVHPETAEQPAPRPQPGPSGVRVPEPAEGPESPARLPEAERRAIGVPSAGFDLGWALACAGLGLAAAMLVVPRTIRRRTARKAARSRATAGPAIAAAQAGRPPSRPVRAVPQAPSSIEPWPTTSRRPSTT